MKKNRAAVVRRIALSAVAVALYFVVMLTTAEFSFGIYQIRIATALYALALPYPFLVLPLGIANCLSNVLGGMAWDIAGGFAVGILTAGVCALAGKLPGRWKLPPVFAAIEFAPALIVPLWLAPTLGVPYWTLAASLLVGQLLPAALGTLLVFFLEKRFRGLRTNVFAPAAGREKAEVGAADETCAEAGDCAADKHSGTDGRVAEDVQRRTGRQGVRDKRRAADEMRTTDRNSPADRAACGIGKSRVAPRNETRLRPSDFKNHGRPIPKGKPKAWRGGDGCAEASCYGEDKRRAQDGKRDTKDRQYATGDQLAGDELFGGSRGGESGTVPTVAGTGNAHGENRKTEPKPGAARESGETIESNAVKSVTAETVGNGADSVSTREGRETNAASGSSPKRAVGRKDKEEMK